MTFKRYTISVLWRILVLLGVLVALAFGIVHSHVYIICIGSLVAIITIVSLHNYITRRFRVIDDFFEAVKYRDFSRGYSEEKAPHQLRDLHKGFNLVNGTIKSINNERQAQFLYLQKILEMVDVGIIAYDLETGEVLWSNDSFLKILDFPSFKNIHFVESRRPEIYNELFETYHPNTASVTLKMRQEVLKVLISDTVFEVEEQSLKLVVIQNIDDTLNQNESEAWKKLLSVMTHEIMNSIAPISSLAETLQGHIKSVQEAPDENDLELDDLYAGISSIQNRSEGLMKFAKTYRSLNKVTQVHRTTITATALFENIENLMRPTIDNKNIDISFTFENPNLAFSIDTHLIEQVLINLILNAIDATEGRENADISVKAEMSSKGTPQILITDNGKGIPEEVQESIFIPFFTTKATGSGIGLSLCKQIMTLHRGRITVTSKEEVGTEIRLMF